MFGKSFHAITYIKNGIRPLNCTSLLQVPKTNVGNMNFHEGDPEFSILGDKFISLAWCGLISLQMKPERN